MLAQPLGPFRLGPSVHPRAPTPHAIDLALALILLSGLVFAFVGLAASSYFVDELFTLYLIDHHGGPEEVVRRALTDTGPPGYYLLLYGWSKLAGLSEAAMRLPSAVCAVAAILVFGLGLEGAFSTRARLFAATVAVIERFWFVQSQSARGYALGLLISAGLLVLAVRLRRGVQDGKPVWPYWAGLTMLGVAGCMVHFYLALQAGLMIAYMILTTGGVRLKAALGASGVLFVLVTAGYGVLLLDHTQQDVHHMWFGTDPAFLVTEAARAVRGVVGPAIAAALAILAWMGVRRLAKARGSGEGSDATSLSWPAGLAGFVLVGVPILGLGVTMTLAPSFSERNLLIGAPMFWLLCATLFDLARPDLSALGGRLALAVIALSLGAAQVVDVEGRFLPTEQEWRASARYVDGQAACDGRTIPTLALQTFGPHTPYYMSLEQSQFYGRYAQAPGRLAIHMPSDFGGRDRDSREDRPSLAEPAPPTASELARARPDLTALMRARLTGQDACPVLAWAAHVVEPSDIQNLRQAIAADAGVPLGQVTVRPFTHFHLAIPGWRRTAEAYVLEARRP
ncbi:glycosyltransferase family 39 protein [Phenylobacterium montanum]|uniref:Glycosyltransferase family 39 protein n=1 Tax=Phenylobacterium montanum TaxID=2823693 RepID=A0A975FZ99_9CAUL|nr:glycosyltransferase family 39 protein [Caulobacter sp. S6]QUD87889.1 glycosyltransferase family 39 protein [Caulobacter sp. S6]